MRRVIGALALILAAYCLFAAATALEAQPTPDRPDPSALAARERHPWPGLIPVIFLGLVAAYAIVVAARRRRPFRNRIEPPSTQDPPSTLSSSKSRRDTSSH